MFTTAEKTNRHTAVAQQRATGSVFSRKAAGSFFGPQESPSFFHPVIQAKTTISSPDDPQEKEADTVAEQVMRLPDTAVAPPEKREEETLQRKEEEKELAGAQPMVQTKEEPALSRQEQEEKVQMKPMGIALSRRAAHPYTIQRTGRGPPDESATFEDTLAHSKGGGTALPTPTRQKMESGFNADFSSVRIHTGTTAEALSRSINAQAFAHGNDIYFNSGKFSPNTPEGGHLLAHELTHTIQQGASRHVPSTSTATVSVAPKKLHIAPSLSRRQLSGGHASFQRKEISSRPKSLRELRRDVFQVDRQPAGAAPEEKSVATEQNTPGNVGNWSVDGKGALVKSFMAPPPGLPVLQPKEEQEAEKEESKAVAPQPMLQKKDLSEHKERGGATGKYSPVSVQQSYSHASGSTNVYTQNKGALQATAPIGQRGRGPPVEVQTKMQDGLVQRSWLSNAWNAVSGFVGEAAAIIAQGLDAARQWMLRRIRSFVQNIPGYRMISLILQQDPVTGEPVEHTGRNLLLAGLDLLPMGGLFRQVLERLHAINEAAAWIEGRLADLVTLVGSIGNRFSNFIDRLSLDDIGNPEAVLNNVANLFRGIFNDVTGFLHRAAVAFLEMIKRIMLRLIVDFVRSQVPRLYPLLRVALGHDPVTGEAVPRNGTNILYAALDATDAGREQRRQMQETGTFGRIAGWIDRGIAVFSTAYTQLRLAFTNLWESVTIENLFAPVETFNRIYADFAAPVILVRNFLRDLALEIVRAIKDALLRRLSNFARTVRGFTLVTVIIGRDPFTGEAVPLTIPNIIRGFMGLMEGGEEQYRQMEESGAIARTTQRILAAVARLNMTPAFIIRLFTQVWNSFGLNDLARPFAAFNRVLAQFGEPIGRLVSFVVEIVRIVVEMILQVMNFPTSLIANIISRAMQAFDLIQRDPVGFLKNLLRAIKQGFLQFFDRIGTHLLNGLTGWLLSELRDANVPAPTDFSLRGIIGWVLQVLGISMDKIWEKLAAHPRIGPERVARIRAMINTLEGIWTFIRDVQERGMAAIWDKIQEQLTRLWDTVLDSIKNWIMERVVNQITARLLSMLDPTGIMAVVNSAIALYRAIQSFVRYLRQMLEIVNSFVEGTVEIAQGNVTRAADFLEGSMGRAMPVVIGFLANQVGLSGIGRRVGEMIGRAQEMVDHALTWLVNRAVNTGMALLDRVMAMGRSAVDTVRNALGLRRSFRTANQHDHSVTMGDNGSIIVASTPKPLQVLVSERRTQIEAENTSTPSKIPENTSKITALDRIIVLKTLIDGLLPQYNVAVDGNRRRADQIRANINGHMNEIVEKLIVVGIEVEGSNNIETHVTHTELDGNRASRVVAQPLTAIPGNTTGSQPHENTPGKPYVKPGVWTSNWVGAHLLNHHLHGPGVAWNMVSGTKETNNNMKTEVENTAKHEISAHPDKQYYYEVSVTYYAEQPARPFVKFFPFQINLQWGELLGQRGSWTRGPARGRSFTQDSPDLTNTIMPAFNESSASRLWEASRSAGMSVPQTVFEKIVDARRTIPMQSFGNDVGDLVNYMDTYYANLGLAPAGQFTTLYSGPLRTLAASHIFMHY